MFMCLADLSGRRARRRCATAAAVLLLSLTLGGCGFAQVFCGNQPGTCQAEMQIQ